MKLIPPDAILVTHHQPDPSGGVLEPPARMARGDRCCTHAYTLSNLKFARAVEPGNLELIHYTKRCKERRAGNLPTLPSSIGLEKTINPFLHTRHNAVMQAARGFDPGLSEDDVATSAAIREWKNAFK